MPLLAKHRFNTSENRRMEQTGVSEPETDKISEGALIHPTIDLAHVLRL
ncbi:MAG TPA: hypothetical protein VL361_23135 [Candidatus Limnocylindrales bacterium]|nr:hypothetical protein [Candidatus Limnocylindrales bacterium]